MSFFLFSVTCEERKSLLLIILILFLLLVLVLLLLSFLSLSPPTFLEVFIFPSQRALQTPTHSDTLQLRLFLSLFTDFLLKFLQMCSDGGAPHFLNQQQA